MPSEPNKRPHPMQLIEVFTIVRLIDRLYSGSDIQGGLCLTLLWVVCRPLFTSRLGMPTRLGTMFDGWFVCGELKACPVLFCLVPASNSSSVSMVRSIGSSNNSFTLAVFVLIFPWF